MHHMHVQPSEPSAIESNGDPAKSDAAQQSAPAARNAGQQRDEK